jgi:hypothetical protein
MVGLFCTRGGLDSEKTVIANVNIAEFDFAVDFNSLRDWTTFI